MNAYDGLTWEKMLKTYPRQDVNTDDYHPLLCPEDDYPEFLDRYLDLPILQRLKGIGLLCGTDWTTLYRNRFYYSRFDHSKGCALIVWHFTHDKAQTIAGLLHDVSTPVFSHVSDFRKGDALTQTATEAPNAVMIREDEALAALLEEDGLTPEMVADYHVYPVADNEIPRLSADRLEYMYPSGLALDGCWTLEEIQRTYDDVAVLENEDGKPELGFRTVETAELYCQKFCQIGHILQLNENKLTLQLLGKIMNMAVQEDILSEDDFMTLTEEQIIARLNRAIGSGCISDELRRLYITFRNMTHIEHTEEPLDGHFCVNLEVKQRYIDPLVLRPDQNEKGLLAVPLSEVSPKARSIIDDFLSWHDTPWGCVSLKQN